jgi:hypothetical protein
MQLPEFDHVLNLEVDNNPKCVIIANAIINKQQGQKMKTITQMLYIINTMGWISVWPQEKRKMVALAKMQQELDLGITVSWDSTRSCWNVTK